MVAQWVKKRPSDSGQFWTATRDGLSSGLVGAAYDSAMEKHDLHWKGWWWSEPVNPPDPPDAQAWDERVEAKRGGDDGTR